MTLVDWKSPNGPPPWNSTNIAVCESPDRSGGAEGSSVGVGSGVAVGEGIGVEVDAGHWTCRNHSG